MKRKAAGRWLYDEDGKPLRMVEYEVDEGPSAASHTRGRLGFSTTGPGKHRSGQRYVKPRSLTIKPDVHGSHRASNKVPEQDGRSRSRDF